MQWISLAYRNSSEGAHVKKWVWWHDSSHLKFNNDKYFQSSKSPLKAPCENVWSILNELKHSEAPRLFAFSSFQEHTRMFRSDGIGEMIDSLQILIIHLFETLIYI